MSDQAPSDLLSPEALRAIEDDNEGMCDLAQCRRNIRRLLNHIDALYGSDPNDPLRRIQAGEPRFILLARDPLSDSFTALWAACKSRNFFQCPDMYSNLMVTAGKMPFHPDRDMAHAMSARQVANGMRMWRKQHQPHGPKNAREVDVPRVTGES